MKMRTTKRTVGELVGLIRLAGALGIAVGTMVSAVLAGLLMWIATLIGGVVRLNGLELFGSEQWSIMASFGVISVFRQ